MDRRPGCVQSSRRKQELLVNELSRPTPIPSFQHRKPRFWEMVIKILDQTDAAWKTPFWKRETVLRTRWAIAGQAQHQEANRESHDAPAEPTTATGTFPLPLRLLTQRCLNGLNARFSLWDNSCFRVIQSVPDAFAHTGMMGSLVGLCYWCIRAQGEDFFKPGYPVCGTKTY